MGIFKKIIKKAEEDEAKRSKDFEVRGVRKADKYWNGDMIELEEDGKDKYDPILYKYSVMHDDHHIGWISAPYTLDEFENNEDLKLIVKDGKVFVRFIPFE